MARKITESIINAISVEDEKVINESIGTRTDVENIDQPEKDKKVIKLAKHLVGTGKISDDDFRLLRDKITSATYKLVDKTDVYALQRGEEVLYTWEKESFVEEEIPPVLETEEIKCCDCNDGVKEDGTKCDCSCHKQMLPDSEDIEEVDLASTVKSAAIDASNSVSDEDIVDLEEGHTEDIIAEVLELAEKNGKHWTEDALRKLTIPQLHVIKSKLINPEYKTRKEIAAEEEREARRAELVKTESDGITTYKIRVGETETILEAATDEEAIENFDKLYIDNNEIQLRDTGIKGLKDCIVDGFKVYVKEGAEGKFSYIIRDPKSSVTLSSGEANNEEEIIDKINQDLEMLDNMN